MGGTHLTHGTCVYRTALASDNMEHCEMAEPTIFYNWRAMVQQIISLFFSKKN
jgi:hypothetical protein